MSNKNSKYPLDGIKVLDFSRVLAGPFAARMLSDLGAEVVKVEPPDGDMTRYWGKEVAGQSGYFHQQNAGKKNICIDLHAEASSALILRMMKQADIVIENYRPDVMPRLGLGYEDLKRANPGIIMLSISGFGHGSPESHRPAYAPVIHAESGLIRRSNQLRGIELHDLPLSVADTNAALHGLIAALSALHMRTRTGMGQHIDMAMIEATIATDDQLHYDLDKSHETGPLPTEIWELPFGAVLLSTDFRYFFRLLVEELGLIDPATGEMDLEEKITVRRRAVQDFLFSLTREKFTETMAAINIPWGDIRDPSEAMSQPTLQARGAFTEIDDRSGGTRFVSQSPYHFSDAVSGVGGTVSYRGENNTEVLTDWLGLTEDEVDELKVRGVILYDSNWHI